MSDGGPGATGIPDPGPGHQVDINFDNVPPNDTPQKATRLGTSSTGDVTVWITDNSIGGKDNESNYFVFRSGPQAGVFLFTGCFSPPLTGMTGTLWKVEGGTARLPPVESANSTADGPTLQCLDFDQPVLEPNTVYLFGLTATGGAGTYAL
jgi:hypothetical protein